MGPFLERLMGCFPDEPPIQPEFLRAITEPYSGLLAHDHHMTVALEHHHGKPVEVRVLNSRSVGEEYHRRIILVLRGTDTVVLYVATAPALFIPVVEQLAAAGLNDERTRIVLEKPLGKDGASARAVNDAIGAVFAEYVGADEGLGIWMQTAKNAYRTDLVFVAIGITALLSLGLFALVGLAERLVIPWERARRRDGGRAVEGG